MQAFWVSIWLNYRINFTILNINRSNYKISCIISTFNHLLSVICIILFVRIISITKILLTLNLILSSSKINTFNKNGKKYYHLLEITGRIESFLALLLWNLREFDIWSGRVPLIDSIFSFFFICESVSLARFINAWSLIINEWFYLLTEFLLKTVDAPNLVTFLTSFT